MLDSVSVPFHLHGRNRLLYKRQAFLLTSIFILSGMEETIYFRGQIPGNSRDSLKFL